MTIQIKAADSQTKILIVEPLAEQSNISKSKPDAIHPQLFDIKFWKQHNAVTGQSKGRHITWFVDPCLAPNLLPTSNHTEQSNHSAPSDLSAQNNQSNNQWVLRHYYRGGVIAKFNRDNFLFTGTQRTRCFLELSLLQKMVILKLPVPRPIAGRVVTQGLWYQADILIEKIPNTNNLVQLLKETTISKEQWQMLGRLIARFHSHGIFHSDLNAHNILLDDTDKFWLIDFDKCDQRKQSNEWQQANLARLRRSFDKEKSLHSRFNFNEQSWDNLFKGYELFFADNQ